MQPYYENFGKRSIKSPKLYFTDVGLASYLLGIENTVQMQRDPLRGNLFENLIVMELIKSRYNQGKDAQLYYFRDTHGHEIDLIFQSANQLIPIEIKAGMTFNKSFLKNFPFFEELVQNRYQQGFLIYTGEHEQQIGLVQVLNYMNSVKAVNS